MVAPADEQRAVTVKLENMGDLKCGENVLPYTVANAPLAFTEDDSQDVDIKITQSDWNAAKAGTYTGTLTFKVAVENIPLG